MMPETPRYTALLAAALAALGGFAALYVTLGRSDNASPPAAGPREPGGERQSLLPSGPGHNPLSQGQMAAFVFHKEPEALPAVRFIDRAGRARSLEEWRGKVVLLNLWATWCLPCRKEMPALDRLGRQLGSDSFEVVAVSVDRTGVAGARKFLTEAGAEGLTLYADPTVRLAAQLRAAGLPATLLIDREGRELGRLLGPAEWDGADAERLIRAVLQARAPN